MTTARQLIEQAYRDIGVIGRGKTMSSYLSQEGLSTLNQMLGMWSTEHFLVPSRSTDVHVFIASKSMYQIGPGGDIDTIRPEEVLDGFIRVSEIDYPLNIFTMGEYNDITYKGQGYIPSNIWYEPSYPLGAIYFDVSPAVDHELNINSYKPITEFEKLETDVSFPAGYEGTIRYNLALMLAPANGKTPNQMIHKFAATGIDNLKRVRAAQRAPISKLPNEILGHNNYNFISDQYR